MKSLIIYGSQYGTAKAYATKLSEITEIPCVSYEQLNRFITGRGETLPFIIIN